MINITLRQCEYFRAVAENGGITAAARAIGISQPAVAQAIDKLEELTGLVLFTRFHARGMELTAQGTAFLRYADDLLASAERAGHAIGEISQNRKGTIRLGCFQSIAPFCLAQIVRGYRERAPGVVLDVSEQLHGELESALTNNELDLAVMYELGLDPAILSWRPLASVAPYLIVSPDHRLAHRKKVSLKEIGSEDYILFDAPGSRDYFYGIFARHGIGPQIAFRSSSIESVRCSVANGLGVSILAMRPASDQTYDGNHVVPIELEEELPPTPIVIAVRNAPERDDLTRPFIQFCEEVFSGF